MTIAGTMIGAYRVAHLLGSGAMGEVYIAHDTKLGRDVAIKILPAAMSHDPDCRVRFEREARLLAALNHPHIATIFAVEEIGASGTDEGTCAIVMELVEGQTLADRIGRRPLPPHDSVHVAAQIVDALEAAHGKGIVHRDLKPANIKVTAGGSVKVLDFGLAVVAEAAAQGSTIDSGMNRTMPVVSQPGMIIGTATYMSPEQVRGQPVDRRADIWAFGCVLYEMLVGKAPFAGPTAADVMAATLDREPNWASLPATTPPGVRRLLKQCLEKDVDRRLGSISEARAHLGEAEAAPPRASSARLWIAAAVIGAVAVGGGLVVWRARSSSQRPPAPPNLSFTQLTSDPGIEWFPNLSPDGKWVAYAGEGKGNRDIFLQSVNGQTPINLTADSSDDDDQPAFSPDGERIAFRSQRDGGGIFVMGRTGESLRRITRAGFNPAWSPDGGDLVYATEKAELDPQNTIGVGALWVVNVASGAQRKLDVSDAVLPSWSPHGRRIAYTTRRVTGGARQLDIWTSDTAGHDEQAVTADGAFNWNPVWSPDGQYLYFASGRGGPGNLWRVPIDEASGKTRGQPEPLTTPTPFLAHLTISADGSHLAYSSVLRTRNIQRLTIDPATATVKGEPVWLTNGSRTWSNPDPSPDGRSVAFYSNPQPEHLYVARRDGSGLRQITADSAFTDRVPRWSPDGQWLAFFSNRVGGYEVWKIRADGSELQQLTEVPDASFPVWSPDGSRMAVTMTAGPGHPDNNTYIFDPNRPWKSQTPENLPTLAGGDDPFVVNAWSGDGTRLAGMVGLGGLGIVTYSLRTRTYDRLTSSGGYPVWLPDNQRLLFVSGGKSFFVLDTVSRKAREVFSVKGDVIGPAQLSRDGRDMYFSRRVTEADIWLLTLTPSGKSK